MEKRPEGSRWKKVVRREVISVSQTRRDAFLNSRDGKVECRGFGSQRVAEGFEVGCEKKQRIKVMLRFLVVAFVEVEKTQVKELLNSEALYEGNGLDNYFCPIFK